MKRLLILLLCASFLLCGCESGQHKYEEPVTFYYPRSELSFGKPDGVIGSETREAAGKTTDPAALLAEYLRGPDSDGLRSPFPSGTAIEEMAQEGNVLKLRMNDPFSRLSGMKLTVACACLARTCLSLTDCQSVQIIINGTTPETQRIITMDEQALLLMDDIITTTPTETQEGL